MTSAAQDMGNGEASLTTVGLYPVGLGAAGFIGVTRLAVTGGEVAVDGGVAYLRGAERVVLLTRMDRPESAPRADALRKTLAEVPPAEYDWLLARHTAVHGPSMPAPQLTWARRRMSGACPSGNSLSAPAPVSWTRHWPRSVPLRPVPLLSSSGVLPPRG